MFRADTAEGAESIRANGTSQVQEIRAEAAEADTLLSADPDLAESNFAAAESFVHAKWREPARQSMEGSVAAFLEFVHAVVEPLGDPNDVRIIFLV